MPTFQIHVSAAEKCCLMNMAIEKNSKSVLKADSASNNKISLVIFSRCMTQFLQFTLGAPALHCLSHIKYVSEFSGSDTMRARLETAALIAALATVQHESDELRC